MTLSPLSPPDSPITPVLCWCNNGVQTTGHFLPSVWHSHAPSGYGAAGTGAYHCTMCHSEYVPGSSQRTGGHGGTVSKGTEKCLCSVDSIFGKPITARCGGATGAAGAGAGCGGIVITAYTNSMLGFWDGHWKLSPACKPPAPAPRVRK